MHGDWSRGSGKIWSLRQRCHERVTYRAYKPKDPVVLQRLAIEKCFRFMAIGIITIYGTKNRQERV